MKTTHTTLRTFAPTPLVALLALVGLALGLSGCLNNVGSPKNNSKTKSATATSTAASGPQLYVSSVQLSGAEGSSSVSLNLFFDTARSAGPVSAYCAPGTCSCRFEWDEINRTGSSNVGIKRQNDSPISAVQNSLVICGAPEAWNTGEIVDNTPIRIRVIATSSTAKFNVPPYTYVKGGKIQNGSFTDATGTNFQNILRYSCFEQTLRGTAVQSRQDASGYVYANQFCISKGQGGDNRSANCPDLTPPDFTPETHPYHLYTRESERGDLSVANNRYVCPQVREALPGLTSPNYYPFDSTFALAMSPSATFPIGVEAKTKLSVASQGNEPVIQNSSCFGTSGQTPSDGSGLIVSCLGFAAKPDASGSCPALTRPDGSVLPTYRLRRYLALRPKLYDADGFPLRNAGAEVIPGSDVIYVVDRPVVAAGVPAERPFTMLGPKPCPVAYFDKKGVTAAPGGLGTGYPGNRLPGYVGSSSNLWSGKNIDGLEFPFEDRNAAPKSCSAVLPLFSDNKTTATLSTIHSTNTLAELRRVAIRPRPPYRPEYIEDLEFRACAPLSNTFRDPPLHFAKDAGGNVAYCAETVPSQNDNVLSLETRNLAGNYLGSVRNYTSHVAKNSNQTCARAPTVLAGLPATYPAGGAAYHPASIVVDPSVGNGTANQTCDRTTVTPQGSWPFFPLLAPAADTESVLSSSPSYRCAITYDAQNGKQGLSPAGGCCGAAVGLTTGAGAGSAHLEPSENLAQPACLAPAY